MRTLTILILVVFVLPITYIVAENKGFKRGVSTTELQSAADELISERMIELETFMKSNGIEAMADICTDESMERTTAIGTLWLKCGVTAVFFDPATYKVVETEDEVILPVALYTRVENALGFLEDGYQVKDITIIIWAFRKEPETRYISSSSVFRKQELTIPSLSEI